MKDYRMGKWYKVLNTLRRPSECETYHAIKVENELGDSEKWLLFTTAEKDGLTAYTMRPTTANVIMMKEGRLYPVAKRGKKQYIAKLDGSLVFLTDAKIRKAYARAQKNTEDVPKQSRIADALD